MRFYVCDVNYGDDITASQRLISLTTNSVLLTLA